MRDQEPFINIQGNAIFYSWTKSNDKTGGEIADVSIFDQVVVELKRLIQQKALVQKQPK
jgi:predicted XRE-type DNA-binding protein